MDKKCLKFSSDAVLAYYSDEPNHFSTAQIKSVAQTLNIIQKRLAKYEAMAKRSDPNFPHLHSHLFRKSKATHMGDKGVALPTVSRFLGHSNPSTTLIYVNPSQKNIRKAIEKTTANCQLSEEEQADYEKMRARLCGIR